MKRLGLPAAITSLFLAAAGARADDGLFRGLSFDAALKTAAAEKKIVLVDFFTDHCVPCKRMDLTSWKDAAVASFVNERAVPLRLDAFKEDKLVARYHLREYPTVLLVRPDGTELDRLVGFGSPEKFFADLKDAFAGRSSLQRAREAAAAAEARGDAAAAADARKDIADLLAQKGDPSGALKEYLWLFDDGMKKLPQFAGVRRSFLLMSIFQLGRDYPPALAALRTRRDEAKRRLEGPAFTADDSYDFAALNGALGDKKATLAYFDSLHAGDPRRVPLGLDVFEQLLNARRYSDAAGAKPAAKIRSDFELEAGQFWGPRSNPDPEYRRMDREYAMESASQGLEALAGAGRLDDARSLIRRMRAVEDAPWVRAILRKHLKRAGRPGLLED